MVDLDYHDAVITTKKYTGIITKSANYFLTLYYNQPNLTPFTP
ncbi:MAG: hypothetical protein RBR74_00675 [Ignavibacteriaceae bacterium]|nr:hypothetical protein [Ignavibacteriaceae bacterium]